MRAPAPPQDNLSRGNLGAIEALRTHVPAAATHMHFIEADLGRKDEARAFGAAFGVAPLAADVGRLLSLPQVMALFARASPPFDVVIHFAAVAFVGESVAEPLRYYHNITANTVILLEAMGAHDVHRLIYSSTCATYGNPSTLPITEAMPAEPINPYGRAKLMAEQAVRDYAAATPRLKAAVLRYFNVFGADPEGRLGELPRAELRSQGRISSACYDAALGLRDELTIMGTTFPTRDGTCVRDYVHVTDLVDAHVAVLGALANPPVLYNVGTGKGVTVREFVNACLKVTGARIRVREQAAPRPGDYAEVYADVSKIREGLNWTARYTDLEASMRHAWAWRQKHATTY